MEERVSLEGAAELVGEVEVRGAESREGPVRPLFVGVSRRGGGGAESALGGDDEHVLSALLVEDGVGVCAKAVLEEKGLEVGDEVRVRRDPGWPDLFGRRG